MNPSMADTPNPQQVFAMFGASQQSAALLAAIHLDLFTALADGPLTAAELGKKINASERGTRTLADYLCIPGLLRKQDGRYSLSPTAQVFLNRRSPAAIADAANWWDFISQQLSAERMVAVVRQGGNVEGIAPPEAWVIFARSMGVIARLPAKAIAEKIAAPLLAQGGKVLDVAGGHGEYGIAVARHAPKAEVTILDGAPVLAVARENADKAGLGARYHTLAGSIIPGSEGEVELKPEYNLILVTGFLHMFSPKTNEAIMAKVKRALAPGGAVIVEDFIPNPDRISPPMAAGFSLTMLFGTAEGDSYTEAEFRQMFAAAGFSHFERHQLGELPMSAMLLRP
jgi:ubiquinone/menaquinone biosynthesis C-methylase UbiE